MPNQSVAVNSHRTERRIYLRLEVASITLGVKFQGLAIIIGVNGRTVNYGYARQYCLLDDE